MDEAPKDKDLNGSQLNIDFYSFPAPEMQALTASDLSFSSQREAQLLVLDKI